MSEAEAQLLVNLIESATDFSWPPVRDGLIEAGYLPEEIIYAWESLERVAGMSGTAPCLDDFR